MQIETLQLTDLKPYEKNARQHPRAQIDLLAKNIERFGFTTPILIDENNEVIAGHGRLLALKQLNRTEAPCVRINGLSQKEIKALRLADNKLASMGDDDMELVIAELKALEDDALVTLTGFDSDLLVEPDEKDDVIPENPPTRAKLGDLWQLGQHRVLCGDSTTQEAISRLMDGNRAQMCFTDPPYNVNYTGGMGTHDKNEREGIKNDNMSKSAFKEFMRLAMKLIVESTDGGIYVCMSSSELDSLKEAFEEAGGHWQSFIIWVKSNFTLSRADYQNTYEPILYGWRDGIVNHYFTSQRDIANVWEDLSKVKSEYDGKHTTITFQGFKVKISGKVEKGEVIRKKQHTDIWRHDKPTKSELHPTQKPVSLVLEALLNSSNEGDIVLDTFAGGGSTLIACQKTGRISYNVELDPKYVDVILKRWEDYTNQKAVLLSGINQE